MPRRDSRGIQSSSTGGVPRRRNGRTPACQPCSRRKVACDHRHPVCSRCERGGIAERCVYLAERGTVDVVAPPASPTSPHNQSVALQANGFDLSRLQHVSRPLGYLGATNFSAVYLEAEEHLPDAQGLTPASHRYSVPDDMGSPATSEKVLTETAISILRCVPDKDSSTLLYRRVNNGWCQLALERLLGSFWPAFSPYLENQSHDSLGRMAEKLCGNTACTWREDETDPGEWFRAFSGWSLRWEALGMLFIAWAYGAGPFTDQVPTSRFKDLKASGWRRLRNRYKSCAWRCAELARRFNSCNSILLWVLWKHSLLESAVSGDGSMETWRLHSEVVGLTTYMGLHVSPASPEDRSISVQIRRRMYACVYKIDKVMAVFTGRPPLLSSKYSTTPLPIDMSDEELLGDIPPGEVDANGWSTEGKLMISTMLRSRTMIAQVAERILEVALQRSDGNTTEQLLALKQQAVKIMSQIPDCLIYVDGDSQRDTVSPVTHYSRLHIRLEHLQNMFIIERQLHRHGHKSERLLEISYEMVSLSLLFWTQRNKITNETDNLEWIAMQFGAPGGGILCAELLQPQMESSRSMTRSNIVQKLGLLAEFLGCVEPGAPNESMCRSVEKILRHVLDQALNAEQGRVQGMNGTEDVSMGGFMLNWDLDMTLDMNYFFNFDSLDTFDWLRSGLRP